MKILDRYLLRAFLGIFLGSLFAVSFLFTVLSILDSITYLMNVKGVTLPTILRYYLLQLPQTIYMSAPVSSLLSSMITLATLNQRHELMAMRAAGISLARTTRPVLVASLFISLGLFGLGNTLVPYGNRYFLSAKHEINKNQAPPEGRLWYVSEAEDRSVTILRIESMDRKTGSIQGLTALRAGPGFQLKEEMVAKSARFEPGRGWRLSEVKTRRLEGLEVPQLFSTPESWLPLPDRPSDLLVIQRAPEEMTFSELNRHLATVRRFGRSRTAYLVELQSRFAIPLAATILVLVGAPLAIRPVRQSGLAFGILGAIIVGFAYFVIIAEFLSLAKAGLISPEVGAWSANLLFGLLGAGLFSRLRK